MNPCPCGYLGDKERECKCSPYQIKSYIAKLSGPMLDRFDLQVVLPKVPYKQLRGMATEESSDKIKKRVVKARQIQTQRFNKNIKLNSVMTSEEIKCHCVLDEDTEAFLKKAYHTMKLSARSLMSCLKIGRTIADLAGVEYITKKHIAEALQYRRIDKEVFENA